MIVKLIVVLIASVLSGLAYRAGGGGWNMNTKVRDWGCPLIAFFLWWYLRGLETAFWWVYLATFLLSWLACTTYYKKKGTDAEPYHFALHGIGLGLASLPFIWLGVPWWVIVVRSGICGLGMFWVAHKTQNDFLGEFGRGVAFIGTLPFLLI